MAESRESFAADKPVRDPEKDDLFGYAPFAEHLAKAITTMGPPEGFIIGICGEWGTGKSTLIEFVKHYLYKLDDSARPIVVEFNPWWFTGCQQLIELFFAELLSKVAPEELGEEKNREIIARFLGMISHVPVPGFKMAEEVGKWIGEKKGIRELREHVESILTKKGSRILVILDDVDRLTAEEIRVLFSLVKAVGDFPNIVYLIAFDRQVVVKALSELGLSGQDYLEKIVQLPIDLPKIDQASLDSMFRSLFMSQVLAYTDVDPEVKAEYLLDIYIESVRAFLDTPRKVVRLVNALKLTYPALAAEVNMADFVGLECLRLFNAPVYNLIRANTDMFAGVAYESREESEPIKKFHKTWLEGLDAAEKGLVKRLMSAMFPRFDAAFRPIYDYQLPEWRSQLRACAPERIEIYFRFGLPEGELSRLELNQMLELSDDPASLEKRLLYLASQKRPDGRSRALQALDSLIDIMSTEDNLDQSKLCGFLRSLTNVGDEIVAKGDSHATLWDGDNMARIRRFIVGCLEKLDRTKRSKLIENSVRQGRAIATIVELVSLLGGQHGKYGLKEDPESERIVTVEELLRLEETAAERVSAAAKEGTLVDSPRLDQTVYRWSDWANKDLVQDWFAANEEHLLAFLRSAVPDDQIPSRGDALPELRRLGYRTTTRKYIDVEKLNRVIDALTKRDDLTGNDRIRLMLLAELD